MRAEGGSWRNWWDIGDVAGRFHIQLADAVNKYQVSDREPTIDAKLQERLDAADSALTRMAFGAELVTKCSTWFDAAVDLGEKLLDLSSEQSNHLPEYTLGSNATKRSAMLVRTSRVNNYNPKHRRVLTLLFQDFKLPFSVAAKSVLRLNPGQPFLLDLSPDLSAQ